MRPATYSGIEGISFLGPSVVYMVHPQSISSFDLQFTICLFLLRVGSPHFLGIRCFLATLNVFPSFPDDVLNQQRHTVFTFKATTLNTLETLRVWLISELFFFVADHY